MAIFVSSSLIRDFSCFCDNSMHIAEVLDDKLLKMLCKLELVVKYHRSQSLISWCLVAACPSIAFYLCAHLLSCKLGQSAANAILVYVASLVVSFLVLLFQNLQLVLIACFMHNDNVFDKICLVRQLD